MIACAGKLRKEDEGCALDDYNGIRDYYESIKLFTPFESYEEGYVSQGKKKSFLYVEPIVGDFFYYYLFD